jgi:hypothetical protein
VGVVITDVPVYMRERGGGARGGCGIRSVIPVVIHTEIHLSLTRTWEDSVGTVGVVITDAPVYMRERGGGGRGGCGIRSVIPVVIHTEIHQSRGLGQTLTVGVVITDTPVYIRDRGGGRRGG